MKFNEAIETMLKDGEFDKMIKWAKKEGRLNDAKEIEAYKNAVQGTEVYIPFIPLLMNCKNVDILQNAICHMQGD